MSLQVIDNKVTDNKVTSFSISFCEQLADRIALTSLDVKLFVWGNGESTLLAQHVVYQLPAEFPVIFLEETSHRPLGNQVRSLVTKNDIAWAFSSTSYPVIYPSLRESKKNGAYIVHFTWNQSEADIWSDDALLYKDQAIGLLAVNLVCSRISALVKERNNKDKDKDKEKANANANAA